MDIKIFFLADKHLGTMRRYIIETTMKMNIEAVNHNMIDYFEDIPDDSDLDNLVNHFISLYTFDENQEYFENEPLNEDTIDKFFKQLDIQYDRRLNALVSKKQSTYDKLVKFFNDLGS